MSFSGDKISTGIGVMILIGTITLLLAYTLLRISAATYMPITEPKKDATTTVESPDVTTASTKAAKDQVAPSVVCSA